MAHAKLLFKPKADVEDVRAVRDILNDMFATFGLDMDKGKFDQSLLTGVTANESKIQAANRVWAEVSDPNGDVSITDFMKALAESPSYDETSAKTLFDNWDRGCIVRMNKDGTWRKII
jgi:DNA replicative helicase MCM subunit Mcm2 (Cdc46/Mcm family)